jgi:hypothetical protein
MDCSGKTEILEFEDSLMQPQISDESFYNFTTLQLYLFVTNKLETLTFREVISSFSITKNVFLGIKGIKVIKSPINK